MRLLGQSHFMVWTTTLTPCGRMQNTWWSVCPPNAHVTPSRKIEIFSDISRCFKVCGDRYDSGTNNLLCDFWWVWPMLGQKKPTLFLVTQLTLFLGVYPKLFFFQICRHFFKFNVLFFVFKKRHTDTFFAHFLSKYCRGLQEDFKINFDWKMKIVSCPSKKKIWQPLYQNQGTFF